MTAHDRALTPYDEAELVAAVQPFGAHGTREQMLAEYQQMVMEGPAGDPYVEVRKHHEGVVAEAIARFIAFLRERGDQATAAQIEWLADALGWDDGPLLLSVLCTADLVSVDTLRIVICTIWSRADSPECQLDRATWFEWFDRTGYLIDGAPAERPVAPITLFRGCTPDRVRRMAWSSESQAADEFAKYLAQSELDAAVFVAEVEPWRLLARLTPDSPRHREESEVIINPEGLTFRRTGLEDMGGSDDDKRSDNG